MPPLAPHRSRAGSTSATNLTLNPKPEPNPNPNPEPDPDLDPDLDPNLDPDPGRKQVEFSDIMNKTERYTRAVNALESLLAW